MSLVIAFVGARGAVMAGDMREISFGGDPEAVAKLEEDLYCGGLGTDDALHERARTLGVVLVVRDDKCKVRECSGMLVGEVGERGGGEARRRRLYAAADGFVMLDILGSTVTRISSGSGGRFIVLGNECSKSIAQQIIAASWKRGTLKDAVRIVIQAVQQAAAASPSVSRSVSVVQTPRRIDLRTAVTEDLRSEGIVLPPTGLDACG